MAKRVSMGGALSATPRRSMMHTTMTPNRLGSSTNAPNSLTAFDLPYHRLLDPSGMDQPSLEFGELGQRMSAFAEALDRFAAQTRAAWEDEQKENTFMRKEAETTLERKEREIQEAKERQKELFETVQAERQADAAKRSALTQIQADLHSLEASTSSAGMELEGAEKKLASKKQERSMDEGKLERQRAKNRPELAMLENVTGLRVEPSQTSEEWIRFDWKLIDPANWDNEASIVLNLRPYCIRSLSPFLPPASYAAELAELQKNRKVYVFVKHMRNLCVAEFARRDNERKMGGL